MNRRKAPLNELRGGSNLLLPPISRTATRQAERPALSPVAGLSSDLRRPLRLALRATAPALLLGRGRLLHPRRLRSLSHRRAHSLQHPLERAPAAALALSRRVVEALRLQSAHHPAGRAHRCLRSAAGCLPARSPRHRADLHRRRHHAAHGALPCLVRAKHARARGPLRRGAHPVGTRLLSPRGPHRAHRSRRALLRARCAFQGNIHLHPRGPHRLRDLANLAR
jgi:hypothetical protein